MRRPLPVKSFSALFQNFLPFRKFFPFSQAASVATLPSALVVEQFLLGASWVFSIQSFRAYGPRKPLKITRGKIATVRSDEIEPTLAKSML